MHACNLSTRRRDRLRSFLLALDKSALLDLRNSVIYVKSVVRDVGSSARWRTQPLNHAACLERMLRAGRKVSPLLQAPWVKADLFLIDWLHCADQGVAADFLGNLFHFVTEQMCEPTAEARFAGLFEMIQQFYEENQVEDRLDHLRPSFVNGSGYKLRCSAAVARALVPFAAQLCSEMLSDKIPVEAAIKAAAFHLNEVYSCLSASRPNREHHMKQNSIKFALQWVALHDILNGADPKAFRLKPKLHLWLHICSDGSCPSRTWTYGDEDFGGSVAKAARRRGGLLRAQATSRQVLLRFCIANPAVRIL